MCGIAGVFAYRGEAVKREELLAIRDHMAARGPDGYGLWLSDDARIGLAHRRLSIIDLSDAGAQPMHDTDSGLSIVFNGEIYNHADLRKTLEAQGLQFRSHSDTEVLLKLYAQHGADMLLKLRGMYAFAIWNPRRKQLFLARDPLGIKPLYLADDGQTLRFASQVKALLKGQVDTRPEPAGHAGFFVWGSVPEPFTLYRGVRALPAGSWALVTETGCARPVEFDSPIRRLAHALAVPTRCGTEEALERVSKAVNESVHAHLVADVPVGVFLSAGLDSAMIASCAAHAATGARSLRSVTLGFDAFRGMAQDEVPLAAQVAAGLQAAHSCVRIGREDFAADREALLAAMDQPSIDGVNTWFVAKAAAAHGQKVALSGLGGDELFGSYSSFTDVPRMARLLASFAPHKQLGRAFRRITAPLLDKVTSPKYAGLLEYGGSLGGAYLLRRALYMPWELGTVLDPELAAQGWEQLDAERALASTVDGIGLPRYAVSALEMSWYMRNQLLRDADWAGMAHSLEIRVPLVDIELVAAVASAVALHPSQTKRAVAARVAPGLPPAVLDRPKTGFAIPVRDWQHESAGVHERGLRGWARHVYRHSGGAL